MVNLKTATFFYGVREFVAVMFQLVCFSRLGASDFFTGALILFVTLVVFDFPFLSSHLFACLRICVWGTSNGAGWAALQIVWFALAQIAGACAAAEVATWADLDSAVHRIGNRTISNEGSAAFQIVDEMMAVAVCLIGLIHLIDVSVPGMLKNAYWQPGEAYGGITDDSAHESTLQEISDNVKRLLDEHVNPHNVSGGHNRPPLSQHNAVPVAFIMHACLLVAGVTRAFPSAHQSVHISVFLLSSNLCSWQAFWMRTIGGLLGTLVAGIYYKTVYVQPPDVLRTSVIAPNPPAFMYTNLLLPRNLRAELLNQK